jgi:hypothetical protein
MRTIESQDARQTAPPVTQKRPYEPPTATFVPLKLEERLLACEKAGYPPCPAGMVWSS